MNHKFVVLPEPLKLWRFRMTTVITQYKAKTVKQQL